MAGCNQGYECQFVDSVCEDFYCKQCSLVAMKPIITSCCSETYCQSCVAAMQEEGLPCSACGEKDFLVVQQLKYEKRINELQVYCTMKKSGCEWSGQLGHLDTHLDPDQDNCQYVETKCPLHCHMAIPKNKLDQHVAEHCSNRPYVCQHCNFKATYEEVMDGHLPECKYVPIRCPNLCGVTFERDFMEDHMKICRLEEIKCEYSSVGCDGQYAREDQEEHARLYNYKHLSLTVSAVLTTREEFQQRMKEQEVIYLTAYHKLNEEFEQQRKIVQNLELKLGEQKEKLETQEDKIAVLEAKLKEQEKYISKQQMEQIYVKFQEIDKKVVEIIKEKSDQEAGGELCVFEMKNFSKEKARNKYNDWKSPTMSIHCYKYCIGVDANGCGSGRGYAIRITLWAVQGKVDATLKWPVEVKVSVELIHQHGGENVTATITATWMKPRLQYNWVDVFPGIKYGKATPGVEYSLHDHFLRHSELKHFLVDDTLHFKVLVQLL